MAYRSTCSDWWPDRWTLWSWWRCRMAETFASARRRQIPAADGRWTDCSPLAPRWSNLDGGKRYNKTKILKSALFFFNLSPSHKILKVSNSLSYRIFWYYKKRKKKKGPYSIPADACAGKLTIRRRFGQEIKKKKREKRTDSIPSGNFYFSWESVCVSQRERERKAARDKRERVMNRIDEIVEMGWSIQSTDSPQTTINNQSTKLGGAGK